MSLGLYIHVPFCKRKCSYCDFHFSTNRSRQSDMVTAMSQELVMRKGYAENKGTLRTLYLGGGTPSVLEAEELEALFGTIFNHFTLEPGAEVTVEANPEDLTADKLAVLASLGVNRLSIGLQSFNEADLKWMNRAHTPEQASACVAAAREAGISDISVDLIFGLPGMSLEGWEQNVKKALALKPDHLSLYSLSVEKKTALRHWVREGKMELPYDEIVEAQYLFANKQLSAAGFKHYELSSFAKPQKEAQHNTGYWQGLPYLGIGPSAHSFDGTRRSWNYANNARYLKAIGEGVLPVEEVELLSEADRFNEFVMTRLRLGEGLNLPGLEERFGVSFWDKHATYLDKLLRSGMLWRKSDQIGFTPQGWIVSDNLISTFFR